MKYDFNEVRSMLDQGVKVDDLCDAFANEVNRVTAEIEAEKRSEKRYKTLLSDITEEWNTLIDLVCEERNVPQKSAQLLHVNETMLNNILIGMATGISAINEAIAPTIELISNELSKTVEKGKNEAKSIAGSTFEQVIADFLNDK